MSYTIEYNREIFFTEENNIKKYFLFIRHGDNNVFEIDTNLRAKGWSFITKGNINEMWKTIGYYGGFCEGGGLQKAKGWRDTIAITIEDYIKIYRSKLKNAKPLKTFLDKFTIKPYIYIKDDYPKLNEKACVLRDFIKKYDMQSIGINYYEKEQKHYVYNIDDYEELLDFLNNFPITYVGDFSSGFRIEKSYRRTYRYY